MQQKAKPDKKIYSVSTCCGVIIKSVTLQIKLVTYIIKMVTNLCRLDSNSAEQSRIILRLHAGYDQQQSANSRLSPNCVA